MALSVPAEDGLLEYIDRMVHWTHKAALFCVASSRDVRTLRDSPRADQWSPSAPRRNESQKANALAARLSALPCIEAPLPCIDESVDLLYFLGHISAWERSDVIGQLGLRHANQ